MADKESFNKMWIIGTLIYCFGFWRGCSNGKYHTRNELEINNVNRCEINSKDYIILNTRTDEQFYVRQEDGSYTLLDQKLKSDFDAKRGNLIEKIENSSKLELNMRER